MKFLAVALRLWIKGVSGSTPALERLVPWNFTFPFGLMFASVLFILFLLVMFTLYRICGAVRPESVHSRQSQPIPLEYRSRGPITDSVRLRAHTHFYIKSFNSTTQCLITRHIQNEITRSLLLHDLFQLTLPPRQATSLMEWFIGRAASGKPIYAWLLSRNWMWRLVHKHFFIEAVLTLVFSFRRLFRASLSSTLEVKSW